MVNRTAAIITDKWAAVAAALVLALITGGVTYAWNTNADFAVLRKEVANLTNANLEIQITAIKENLKAVKESTVRIENKMDKLLERK